MDTRKTIMAVGGHIGDMELTTGGVLATLSLEGYKIVTVALTAGEKGNPPDVPVAAYRAQKVREAAEFAGMLGGESVVLDVPDGSLEVSEEMKFAVCDLIRRYKPSTLLTHWKHSMHKDHEATYAIVRDAQFYAALPGFERELPAHFAAGPYYAENWEDPEGFRAYVYMPVSEEGFALWEKAIAKHWFAVHSPSFEYMRYYTALMTVRGAESRRGRAQAFAIDATAMKTVKTEF